MSKKNKMKREPRVWWEELADQYEAWAEDPPGCRDEEGVLFQEAFTCCELLDISNSKWGFCYGSVTKHLQLLWQDQYGFTSFPAGYPHDPDRAEKRFEFCWFMAETIREAIGCE